MERGGRLDKPPCFKFFYFYEEHIKEPVERKFKTWIMTYCVLLRKLLCGFHLWNENPLCKRMEKTKRLVVIKVLKYRIVRGGIIKYRLNDRDIPCIVFPCPLDRMRT